jgi:hypothetical protein
MYPDPTTAASANPFGDIGFTALFTVRQSSLVIDPFRQHWAFCAKQTGQSWPNKHFFRGGMTGSTLTENFFPFLDIAFGRDRSVTERCRQFVG